MSSGLIMAAVSIDPFTNDSTVNLMRINLLAKPTRPACLWLFNFGKIEKFIRSFQAAASKRLFPADLAS
jgi:hypothetical protein